MSDRVDWVDVAKGICIVMVVMMHSTLGVEKAAGATGWMGYVGGVRAALPHAGLLPDRRPLPGQPHRRAVAALSRPQGAALRLFLRALAHHPVRLQGAGHSPPSSAGTGLVREYLMAFVEPWGTLWFIYHLALFLVVTRLLKSVPWPIVWLAAAALEIAPIHTGSVLIDEFASRFVYFYSGYIFARYVFRFAEEARADRATGADRTGALGGAERPPRLQRLRRPAASSAWRSAWPARSRSSPARRSSRGRSLRRRRCAGSASIRSSSISPSSCRWR